MVEAGEVYGDRHGRPTTVGSVSMDRPELPEHLQLLLPDEPAFDLYSHGPRRD